MESLGGNRYWSDRFLAQHIAVTYYWVVVLLYMLSPRYAYYLMELIEDHAYDDYLNAHAAALKTQPAPQVAIDYYRDGDLYMFEEVQTATVGSFVILRWTISTTCSSTFVRMNVPM